MSIKQENVPFSLNNQYRRSIDARVGKNVTFTSDFVLKDRLYGNYVICNAGVTSIGFDPGIQDGFTVTLHNNAGVDITIPASDTVLKKESSVRLERVQGEWKVVGFSVEYARSALNKYVKINAESDPAGDIYSYNPTADGPSLRYHIFVRDTDIFEFTLPAGKDTGWNAKVRLVGMGSIAIMAGDGTTVTTEGGDCNVAPGGTPLTAGVIPYKYGVVDVQHLGNGQWLVEGDLT